MQSPASLSVLLSCLAALSEQNSSLPRVVLTDFWYENVMKPKTQDTNAAYQMETLVLQGNNYEEFDH